MDVASTRWEWQKRRALWHLLRHTRRRPRSIQASRNTPGLSSHGRSFTSFIMPSTLEKTLMWRHCADWVITVKLIVEIDSTHIWRIGWKLDREIYLFIRFDKNGALDGWDTNWNNRWIYLFLLCFLNWFQTLKWVYKTSFPLISCIVIACHRVRSFSHCVWVDVKGKCELIHLGKWKYTDCSLLTQIL